MEAGRDYIIGTSDIACLVLHTAPGSTGSCWCQGRVWTLAALALVSGHRPVCPLALSVSCMTAHLQDRPEQGSTSCLVSEAFQIRLERIQTYPVGAMEKRALDIPAQDRHISSGPKQAGTGLDAMKKKKKLIRNYINGCWSQAS